MENYIKTIYLIRGSREEPYTKFRNRIFDLLGTLSTREDIPGISVVMTVKEPPIFSVIPFKKDKIASITVKTGNFLSLKILEMEDGFAGAYQVDEAIPVAYRKTWKDGDQSPGINLLTIFRKKQSIDYETFIRRWHLGHTPLSLKIHPLWNYNRNLVKKRLTGSSETWDGIVEEHFKSANDLLNPARFFGGPLLMFYRMLQVYIDTRSFLDYRTIQTYLAMEYHIKSILTKS